MEALITTELENAILQMHRPPAEERDNRAALVAKEQALTAGACRRVLEVFHEVSRDFVRINLGLAE